ncbi:DUF1648 domain-containing protein [Shouchella lehensis]|uniref:DUF1648 domain-containing protein n=1 Tax=Shouchella lehensis G1 TaxID=1246626 RepID=A0A060LQH7_9BACI|nr:DUF1648 domain-containing protein [Shouchella lehensis]AIC93531.1 hypothetical protein BleG1_0923 [Shouchella lehensis G1]
MIKREVSNVRATRLEKGMTTIAALLLIVFWVLFIIIYPKLPTEVPIHSASFTSEAYTYGNKGLFFLLPVLTTGLSLMLFAVRFVPSLFNFPIKITEENSTILIQLTRNMVAQTNVIIVMLFLCVLIDFSFAAFDQPIAGLDFLLIGLLVYLVALIFYYFVIILKKG